MTRELPGYLHPQYIESFRAAGRPLELPGSGGWLLEREIPGAARKDAMGPYPVFRCRDPRALARDLAALTGLVSVALVTDPFLEAEAALLRECFPDAMRPFKEHYVTDLRRNPEEFISPHHRRNARKALAAVSVERCPEPRRHAGAWIALYRHLAAKRSIAGFLDFSDETLRLQLETPGLEMLRATYAGETVAIALWMREGGVAYYHLGACSEAGYRLGAFFAIFRTAVDLFARDGFEWLSLGAGPGVSPGGGGLARFKRGWSTGVRPVYFCGRILDREAYRRLSGNAPAGYFPAYRRGEFR